MSFNEEELHKIKRAIISRPAKKAVATALQALSPRVEAAKALDKNKRFEVLSDLANEASAARHRALDSGANSYSHPDWAAASACESWLHDLIGGSADSTSRVEQIVADLSTEPEEQPAQQKTDWPVILFLFITLPVAFTYGGFWIGILALVVGMTALGWRRRHEGPFPTHRE